MDNPNAPDITPPIKTDAEVAAEVAAADKVAADKKAAEVAAAKTADDSLSPILDKPKTKPAAKTTPPPESPPEVAPSKTTTADKFIYAGVVSVVLGFILRSFL